MNTRQKLTLGIAAIFMVTLTIVGVTYAYFVTRVVNEGDAAGVTVNTASVGSVKYMTGNGNSDVITLSNALPGTTKYKTFSVNNTATEGNALYNVFLTATPGTVQFVHGAVSAEDTEGCYKSSAQPSNATEPTAACFDADAYDNVKVTLYELTAAGQVALTDKISGEGAMSETDEALLANTDNAKVVFTTAGVKATAGTGVTAVDQDLYNNVTIAAGTTTYYVAKVEYLDVDKNQNIENDATLDIKFSIK